MPFIFARDAPKLWRKVCAETSTELSLLAENWKFVLAGLIFQYLHGVAAHGVHYLHRPGPTLQDAGLFLLPELGQAKNYLSETLFAVIFFSFILWTFHPFVFQLKKIYTVLIWCRVFVYLTVSTAVFFNDFCVLVWCRVFLSVFVRWCVKCSGSSPSTPLYFLVQATIVVRYNCLFQGSNLARLPPPESALEVLLINFPQGIGYGCGDLIFSSHMIFTLVFVRTYQKYGTRRCFKQLAWSVAVVQSLLILASRKHYTVDVVVAWYTVNLVVFFIDQKLPELPDRSTSQPLLPMNTREKDSKNREELDKFRNGNSANITT